MRQATSFPLTGGRAILLLRWMLIVATSYVVLFGRPDAEPTLASALFVALYLASNLVLGVFLGQVQRHRFFEVGVVAFDTAAVTVGLALTRGASSDFFLLYFVVMLLGALVRRLAIVVGATAVIAVVYVYTIGHVAGFEQVVQEGYLVRLPFLVAVAVFFGQLVENARSAERNAAEAGEREQRKTDFLSTVSHDLKNPLGLVEAMAASLLSGDRGPLSPAQADLVRRIHANVHRVTSLSLNLLDAANVEAGRITLQKTPLEITDVVEDAISVARSAADSRDVSISLVVDPALPVIEADFMQLGRVVSNLLDNAIKHTPRGTRVVVWVRRIGGRVALSVKDDGPGIPPSERAALFDKYSRRAGPSRADGSGLGLFIVKHIVEAHGGAVRVHSEMGKGTTLTVDLPVRGSDRVPEISRARAESERTHREKRLASAGR